MKDNLPLVPSQTIFNLYQPKLHPRSQFDQLDRPLFTRCHSLVPSTDIATRQLYPLR